MLRLLYLTLPLVAYDFGVLIQLESLRSNYSPHCRWRRKLIVPRGFIFGLGKVTSIMMPSFVNLTRISLYIERRSYPPHKVHH